MTTLDACTRIPSRYVKCPAARQGEEGLAWRAIRNSSDKRRAPKTGARWYAVNCLSNREFLAAAHLKNQGFQTFLPCRRQTRRHARKFDTVLRPFFPGYLFVLLDLDRD